MNLGPAGLGFPSAYVNALQYDAFPAITMSNDMASYGAGGLSTSSYYSHSFSGSVSKFLGRHTLKSGADFRAIHVSGVPAPTPGAYTFTSGFTSASSTSTVSGTGGSLASMLLGFPSAGSVTTSEPVGTQVDYVGLWVQDDFRMTKKLTLNFGVRYDYETGVHSNLNALVGFNPTAVNPIQSAVTGIATPGQVVYAGSNGFSTATHPNSDKFAPRAGFAYAFDSKTSIRGGYGLLWAPYYFSLFTPIGFSNATAFVASTNGNVSPANSLSNPFPTGFSAPLGNQGAALAYGGAAAFSFYDPNSHSTRIHQYSLDIQRELGKGFVVDVGFSGSITHNLIQGTPATNINQLPDADLALGSAALNAKVPNPFFGTAAGVGVLNSATVPRSQLLLPYPEFSTLSETGSDANHALYNSIYVKMQKRLGWGLNFLTSYTWSRNMDESNGANSNTFNAQQSTSQDNYNRAAEWSLAAINTPSRWTTAINYMLPFGQGQKFLNKSKLMDLAVGGWAINVATTMQTGFPLAIYQTNQNGSIGTSVQRPNGTGAPEATSGSLEQRLGDYISAAAFSTAPLYTYGNLARTSPMRGPGTASTDFSLFKSWAYRERYKAQFRMEVFNLTNTPQFYAPGADGSNTGTSINSSQFGQITAQANFPRVFQIGVKFMF
jgi:hypothetical protein